MEVWMLVYVISGLLATAVLFVPLSQAIKVPYTVILAGLGLLLGAIGQLFVLDGADPLQNWISGATSLTLSSEVILFLFLPVLVFEAALSLNVRRLMRDMGVVLLLAVLGLGISTLIVGSVMSTVTGVTLMTCLLLGTICSATDPVAVVGVFKEVGAPRRLATLVEGESLFNDATALVLFAIISGLMVQPEPFQVSVAAAGFVKVFVGGIIVGLATALFFCSVIDRIKNSPLVNHALSVALAYFSFILAEHYLHVSGVMAVVSAGLYFGAASDRILNRREIHALHDGWEQLGFWANSLIFVVMGIVIAGLLTELDEAIWVALAALIAAATTARCLIIYGLLGLFERFSLIGPVSGPYKAVMTWGGLRGAVSLALALIVLESPQFLDEEKRFIVVLVSLFVLSTLFVNATTISVLIRWLKLDRLSNVDEALKLSALSEIHQAVSGETLDGSRPVTDAGSVASGRSSDSVSSGSVEVADHEWMEVGHSVLMGLERKMYKTLLDQEAIDGNLFGRLVHFVEDGLDALRHEGEAGLEEKCGAEVDFGWDFKLSTWLHRRLSLSLWLEQRIGRRFELLSAKQHALEAVIAMPTPALFRAMGKIRALEIRGLTDARLARIQKSLSALSAQFPDYFKSLEDRTDRLQRVNLEGEVIERLSSALMVSDEVANDLHQQLRARKRQERKMPTLEISLDIGSLLKKVPFFQSLAPSHYESLAKQLKPRIALPQELIFNAGDSGSAMYFISSGAVEVALPESVVLLGSGEFFGELALIESKPRSASVRSLGFCELLTLNRGQFESFVADHPEVGEQILATAADRLGG